MNKRERTTEPVQVVSIKYKFQEENRVEEMSSEVNV